MALSIVISLTGAAVAFYLATGAQPVSARAAQQAVATIPQPQGWVAFDADYVEHGAEGAPSVIGRYHRAGDGSLRQEGSFADGTRGFLRIVNIATRTAYRYSAENQEWRVQPVQYPAEGFLAPHTMFRVDAPGLRHLPAPYEGLDAYEYREPGGNILIKVPALNFFTVRSLTDGRTFEMRNISLRPQSADLFMPPADVAQFEKSDQPLVMRRVGVSSLPP